MGYRASSGVDEVEAEDDEVPCVDTRCEGAWHSAPNPWSQVAGSRPHQRTSHSQQPDHRLTYPSDTTRLTGRAI